MAIARVKLKGLLVFKNWRLLTAKNSTSNSSGSSAELDRRVASVFRGFSSYIESGQLVTNPVGAARAFAATKNAAPTNTEII